MKWLINKAFLTPSVEQLLGHQIDSLLGRQLSNSGGIFSWQMALGTLSK